MQASLLDGAGKRFLIPVYQRAYDWKTENCKQLYDDLVKVIRNRRSSHFFGSIVSASNPNGLAFEQQIIDGQQRLTTVSLLLLAMRNLMARGIVQSEYPQQKDKLYECYLINKYEPEASRVKLQPVKKDRAAYAALLDPYGEPAIDSNLAINYRYFYDRIQQGEITIDQLYEAIFRLEVISILLSGDDNPQLIFESLNSTGLALNEGDKIRNYMLMGLDARLQERLFDTYWSKIEACTDSDVSAFVRDYLSVKQQSTPAISRVYFSFKEYAETENLPAEPRLTELLAYAKLYRTLPHGGTGLQRLDACIERLNRLVTTVTRPFLMEVLRLQHEGALSLEQAADAFALTESFLFRRILCDVPTNALNKIFVSLHREIMQLDGTSERYLDKMTYVLTSKQESARFPSDQEFGNAILTKPVYQMNSKNKLYLLERLENHGTIETKDVWSHIESGEYTIEHIMPQHLSPAWVDELGEDYDEIHETWLHRLANLTLTGYNSKYSNSPFAEKRDIPDGFRNSGLRMNQLLAQNERWGLAELEARGEALRALALSIWPRPETAFQPAQEQLESYSLEDEVSSTGRSLARFSLQGQEQPCTSWTDMYRSVMQLLHSRDQSVLLRLAATDDPDVELSSQVSATSISGKNLEIAEGVYLWTNLSTDAKLSYLRRFFRLYHMEPSDLVFLLKNDTDTEVSEATALRYELRRRYWTFALPRIQQENVASGMFGGTHPGKDNWISGFVGYGGIKISCLANMDYAKTELDLVHSDKARNKQIFDALYQHKSDIEQKAQAELNWN